MGIAMCDVDCIHPDAACRARAAANAVASDRSISVLRAAADPIRLRLLAAVAEQSGLCACDLAWVVDRQKSLVSHHLKQLRDAGLLESRRDGRLVRYSATRLGVAFARVVVAAIEDRVAP